VAIRDYHDSGNTSVTNVLGDEPHESLASNGEAMTTTEMANYAYDQIDQARTQLEQLR
jgi:hypothetical protein